MLGKLLPARPPASAGLVPAERQLICYRMTSAPPLSWPVVIPTGASPAEIGKHRSSLSLIPSGRFKRPLDKLHRRFPAPWCLATFTLPKCRANGNGILPSKRNLSPPAEEKGSRTYSAANSAKWVRFFCERQAEMSFHDILMSHCVICGPAALGTLSRLHVPSESAGTSSVAPPSRPVRHDSPRPPPKGTSTKQSQSSSVLLCRC